MLTQYIIASIKDKRMSTFHLIFLIRGSSPCDEWTLGVSGCHFSVLISSPWILSRLFSESMVYVPKLFFSFGAEGSLGLSDHEKGEQSKTRICDKVHRNKQQAPAFKYTVEKLPRPRPSGEYIVPHLALTVNHDGGARPHLRITVRGVELNCPTADFGVRPDLWIEDRSSEY